MTEIERSKTSELGSALAAIRRYERDRNVAGLLNLLDSRLRSGRLTIGGTAALTLAKLGATEHVREIRRLLASDLEMVAFSAAVALRRLGDREAVAELRLALRGQSPIVRSEVARTIGALGLVEAQDDLLAAAVSDPDEETRLMAAGALVRMHHRAAGEVIASNLRLRRSGWDPRSWSPKAHHRRRWKALARQVQQPRPKST